MNRVEPASATPVIAACLCAAWCRLCTGYREVFEQAVQSLVAAHPDLQARWVDIEDEASLVGELDVETFPTLVVVDAKAVRFAGTVHPQPQTLRRLLQSCLESSDRDEPCEPGSDEVESFARRLRASCSASRDRTSARRHVDSADR